MSFRDDKDGNAQKPKEGLNRRKVLLSGSALAASAIGSGGVRIAQAQESR